MHLHVTSFGCPLNHAQKIFSYKPLTLAYEIVIPVCHNIAKGHEILMGHEIFMCQEISKSHE